MEILNKLKKIQSEIETANQSAYDSKQEIENLEYNLSQAGDYISDTSNYLEDISIDIDDIKEHLNTLESKVITKAVIQLVNMLPELDRDYTIVKVTEHFQTKKEEKQEMKTPALKSTTEETTEEN
jgi:chromosome segregation ATPase